LDLNVEIISDLDDLFDRLPQLKEEYDYVVVDGSDSTSKTTRIILICAE